MYIYAVDGPVSRQYPMHIFPLLAPKAAGVAVGHGVVSVDVFGGCSGRVFSSTMAEDRCVYMVIVHTYGENCSTLVFGSY